MEKINLESEREIQYEQIDRKSPEIMEALKEAPIYKKNVEVKARKAVAGEKIVTLLANGEEETENEAKESDWVVTNPAGEEYVVAEDTFYKRYEKTNENGIYAAKGFCRAIKNPFGKPIEIEASWGASQKGREDCLIADTCDAEGNLDGEPYLIEANAFAGTYIQT